MTTKLLFHVVMSAFIYQGQGAVNFALNKYANQSTTLTYEGFDWTADKAVDGNSNGINPVSSKTCSATIATTSNAIHAWEVDIGVQIIVKTITVYGRTDKDKDQLDGITLYLGNTSGPWNYGQEVTSDPSSGTPLIQYVFKPHNVIARFISLKRFGNILTICEVNVEGECRRGTYGSGCNESCGNCYKGDNSCSVDDGRCMEGCETGWHGDTCKLSVNFALHKSANQTTTLTYEGFDWTADKAVDGNSNGSNPVKSRTCSATIATRSNEIHAWEVDIGVQIIVKTITVYGRTDQDKDQLNGVTLYLGNTSGPWNYGQEVTSDPSSGTPLIHYVFKPHNIIARFISLKRIGDILTICEVNVEGECRRGTYGSGCNETCGNCYKGNTSCSMNDGRCTEGCEIGWSDDKCKLKCTAGTYGFNCNETCGYCLNGNKYCLHTNGQCSVGCQIGWKGETCKSECEVGTYGLNCNETCGYCLNGNISCSNISGQCSDGCQSGWRDKTCKSECELGTHGLNCTGTCGYCLNGNNSCSKVSGQCSGGCQIGWRDETCKSECEVGTYGFNCNETCGYCLNGNNSCSKISGQCIGGCQTGWKGETCKSECELGTYGFNCNETCGYCLNGNNSCSTISGQCSGGCQTGWKGETCKSEFQTLEQTSIDVGLIGGSAGSAIAVVALIVTIVVIIVVRRRRKTPQSCPSTGNELSNKKNDVIVYENPSFHNMQTGTGTKASTSTTTQKDGDREIKLTNQDSETYYNLGNELQKGSIPLSSLWDYVQEHFLDETYFAEEFEKLPSGPQLEMTVAHRSENRNKNRYKQLYPYDVNRVLLNPMSNGDSDYINASFIDGYSRPKTYIASQGTTKDNIDDFWRMLWQYDVEKIVMLTGLYEGGKHKCELYWPVEKGQRSSFGSVSVRLLDTDLFADYDMRTLEMTVGNKSKRLTQFHYTAWPDKGVPKAASSIVQFWRSVNRVPTNKPIVVHCSAGIGRTGTYLALDYLANQAKVEGLVNVLACVSNLRRQRVNLVQTKEQYIFLHETLVEALMLSGTATSSENFPQVYNELMKVDSESGKIKLQLEYERLQNEVVSHENVYATIKMEEEDGEESDSKQDEFSAAKKYENRAKNRHKNILPADRHRVYLSTHVSGRNDYINAVIVPSHRQKMGFILTQMPLTDTIIDFWRMINDHEIRTILMFNSESSKTCDIGIYWPTDGEVRFGQFSIRLAKQERHKNYLERTLSFSVIGDKATRSIKQFQFTKWTETADIPGNIQSFLQLNDAVDKWQKEREAKPVVVHCINGAERSGLYCVISTVIDRLNVERDVAITQTIKRIRAIRQQIIPNYEQFQFCHECILQYIKMFETYSNF